MGSLFIFIGILFIVAGVMDKKRERRQDNFNDWCYDNIHRNRNKRRGPRNRRD